ncbi:hypothetical protein CYY_009663 [Polysphondylium violaceum]|uniref:SUI1 domain-containing protein n=1 Tax=Polysphondylium violaceum TaxID=133409 RepID=A0A8J4UVT5_9MYCE|nr:hypothetical protein CYY_009663 [Polysphondylium violaceum]
MEPIIVEYCQVCGFPREYCEYSASAAACLKANGPYVSADAAATTTDNNTTTTTTTTTSTGVEDKLGELKVIDDSKEEGHTDSAAPVVEKKKKKEDKSIITIEVVARNKKKNVTSISGLHLFGIKLADAKKVMANKFSCGCSVVEKPGLGEEINIQGDFCEELVDLIEDKYPQIPLTSIYFIEDKKKVPARR